MSLGNEWLIDAAGCSAKLLAEIDPARRVCERVVATLKLRVLREPLWHQFPAPGGVTGMYLLAESHLTCHTWPETGHATFNLFCCGWRGGYPWTDTLTDLLHARSVVVKQMPRGFPSNEELRAEDERRQADAAIDWEEMNERRYRTGPWS